MKPSYGSQHLMLTSGSSPHPPTTLLVPYTCVVMLPREVAAHDAENHVLLFKHSMMEAPLPESEDEPSQESQLVGGPTQ